MKPNLTEDIQRELSGMERLAAVGDLRDLKEFLLP